jgi:aminoglycoside phosphotransferase (APT) family kinase protein
VSHNPPQQFVDWMRLRLDRVRELRVSPFTAASSGSSNETKLFAVSYQAAEPVTERLVLRGTPHGRGLFPKYDLHLQVGVMRALRGTKISVPTVRWHEEDAAVLGAPFMVMDFIDGTIPSDAPPGFHGHGLFFDASTERRVSMWWAVLEQMVALHSIDWRSLDLPALPGMGKTVADSMSSHLRHLEGWLEWAEAGAIPVIDRGLQWLRDTPAEASRLSLVWGDARPGNVIYKDGRIVSVLDWELATVGRPEFDLSYFMWQADVTAEVNDIPRLAGLPDRDATYAMYESMSGRAIEDPMHAEMFTLVRLAIMIALGVRASVHRKQSRAYLENNVVMRRLNALLR